MFYELHEPINIKAQELAMLYINNYYALSWPMSYEYWISDMVKIITRRYYFKTLDKFKMYINNNIITKK